MFGVNPYSPYGYPPSFGVSGSQMQQSPVAQQPQQNGPDWIQVPTARQVEQVSVQPGGKAWIMIQNEPMFALRTADNMGLITTDYYRFEKVDPSVSNSQTDYVTRAEFEQFVESLKEAKK